MIDKLKSMVLNVLVKKYALGALVSGYKRLEGYKTVLALVCLVAVYLANAFGYIPDELAKQLYAYLSPVAGVTFFEKLVRYQAQAKAVANTIKEEAAKVTPAEVTPEAK